MAPRPMNLKRECTHGGRHSHGTSTAYRMDDCRCEPCRIADRRTSTRSELLRLAGQTRLIPAAPAREHVAALMASGMGLRRISDAAGFRRYGLLRNLMYGSSSRACGPSKRISRDNAARIFSVQLDLADRAYIDATGTRRRIQALVTRGWSLTAIGRELGYNNSAQRLWQMINNRQVAVWNARAVTDLYDRLWDREPPRTTAAEKAAASKAATIAAKKGWASPLAWDDIDNPDETPNFNGEGDDGLDEIAVERFMAGTLRDRPNVHASPERLEAIRRLAAYGMADFDIGQRVGMKGNNVGQVRLRNGIPTKSPRRGVPGGGGVAA